MAMFLLRAGDPEDFRWVLDVCTLRVRECLSKMPQEAAHALAVAPVDLVAIDMPIANLPITGRRVADRLVSAQFGGRGCSTHTPSVQAGSDRNDDYVGVR